MTRPVEAADPFGADVPADGASAGRVGGPRAFPWATPPLADSAEVRQARKRWFSGATFSLLWQVLVLLNVWTDGRSLMDHLVGTAALVIVYAAYIAVPFALWRSAIAGRVAWLAAFAALSGALLPVVGPVAVWTWLLLASLTGFIAYRFWIALAANAVIIACQLAVTAVVGWNSAAAFAPLVTVSVAVSMVIFGRQQRTSQQLDVANDEISRLAVVEERARFSRDLHDVLGHSLTVVTMKSELAVRLVDLDPERAKQEIRDIERLSREALHGLRQAVGGYREADLAAELVSARAALDAAEVTAELPVDATVAARDVRSLFAWVLREGVTNVIRHSGATRCRVRLTRTVLTIEDDGSGSAGSGRMAAAPIGAPSAPGHGLRGLRERADAAGATLETGTSELGGFLLSVERGRR